MNNGDSIYDNSSLMEDVKIIKAGHRKNAEAKRKQKLIDFAICAGVVALFGGLMAAFPHIHHRGKVDNFDEMALKALDNGVGLFKSGEDEKYR